jgi:methionyl-tRNA synthetase
MKKVFVTTPIYYVNDKPHIGHAYTSLASDVFARFKRLDGCEVLFITGTDEHGLKIEKSAKNAGMPTKEFVDQNAEQFRALSGLMNFSNDDYIRTTEPRHIKACQALWRRLVDRDQIYLDSYSGWYSVSDEAYWGESELVTRPDGKKVAPTGSDVEWVEEPSYFFRLSTWQDRLLQLYGDHPEFVAPATRRNEVISFVKSGLRDLSVSRTGFNWGVPVPGDDKAVMYVWLDALTNYLTGMGFPDIEGKAFGQTWPPDLHMVGKDILRFHAIYWPAFLMAADLPLPKRVFAHGWWTNEGQKISKSLGNVIDPAKLVAEFGQDETRYFMMRDVPFGNDGDFSRSAMIERTNSELADGLGNLTQRTLSLIVKNCGGTLPAPGLFNEEDEALLTAAHALLASNRQAIDSQAFQEALREIADVVRDGNGYIARQAPWSLAKTDTARMGTVLYVLVDVLRRVGILLQPIMPKASARLLDMLQVPAAHRSFADLGVSLTPGARISNPEIVFPKIVDAAAASGEATESRPPAKAAVARPPRTKPKAKAPPPEEIEYDDFKKIKLQVGRILCVDKIEGTDKLYRLQLSAGDEERQIISGLAKYYRPDELVGKLVIFVANLKPIEMFGVRSNGMLLAASQEGVLRLLTTDGDLPDGTMVL